MFALIELSGEDGLKIKWDLMFLNGMLEFSNQERRAKQAPFSLDVENSVAPLALGFFFFFFRHNGEWAEKERCEKAQSAVYLGKSLRFQNEDCQIETSYLPLHPVVALGI